MLQETRDKLDFLPAQIPLPSDSQLSEMSDGKALTIPLLCSALTGLTAITSVLDTMSLQLATVHAAVATLPTFPALENALTPRQASIRDLSHRVTPYTAARPAA